MKFLPKREPILAGQDAMGARLRAIMMRSKVEILSCTPLEEPAKPSARPRLFWTPHELAESSDG